MLKYAYYVYVERNNIDQKTRYSIQNNSCKYQHILAPKKQLISLRINVIQKSLSNEMSSTFRTIYVLGKEVDYYFDLALRFDLSNARMTGENNSSVDILFCCPNGRQMILLQTPSARPSSESADSPSSWWSSIATFSKASSSGWS